MGVSELCQRIVCDLEALLRKHALLESFDVVIKENSAERSNRSPVYVVENHLGLESWCVTPVYTFASQQLLGCYDTEKVSKFIFFFFFYYYYCSHWIKVF